MGRDRYRILDPQAPHFVTCTVIQWLPLFAQPANAQILLDALAYLQDQARLTLHGYVIMENHCHLLARSPNLPKTLASFKSYTARQIINRLTAMGSPILPLLALHKARHKTDRDHQVWQEGVHPVLMDNESMVRQRLEYIHNNPVKRGYVDSPLHWRYSSARNYEGMPGLIPVTIAW